jgi:hypothetical protein
MVRKDVKFVWKNIRMVWRKGTKHQNSWEERIKGQYGLSHGFSKYRTRATIGTPTIVNW